MSRTGWLILVAAILVSVLIAVATRGHVILFALPLLFGLPLAGIFGRRRR